MRDAIIDAVMLDTVAGWGMLALLLVVAGVAFVVRDIRSGLADRRRLRDALRGEEAP